MRQQQTNPQEQNEDTYESLISLIENSQGRLAPIIVACDDWALRQRVIDRYESEAREAKIIPYRVVLGREPSVRAALAKLKEENEYLQRGGEAVFTVTGAETLLRVKLKPEDEQSELDKFFGYLQWTREGLREFPYPIVLWVTYRILKEISRRAPDFWSWRKAVLRFTTESEDLISLTASPPVQPEQIEPQSDNFLPPLEELQAEIQQLETTSPDSSNLATLYDQLGQVYANRVRSGKAADLEQEREAAIAAFQKAINQYHRLDRKSAQSAVLGRLGNFLASQSRFRDAIELYQQSLEIACESGDRQREANSLNNLGVTYNTLGDYPQAIEFHQQSLAIKREIGDRQGEASSLNNLGIANHALEAYSQAIEFHQQSLAIKREIGNLKGEANSLDNLGNVYNSLGQHSQAVEFHQQSLEIMREIGDREGEANTLRNLGNAYYSLGQYQQAIELFQQSLETARKIGDRRGEANALFNQALALAKLDQHSESLEKFQQAKQLFIALGLDQDVQDCDAEIDAINQISAAELHS